MMFRIILLAAALALATNAHAQMQLPSADDSDSTPAAAPAAKPAKSGTKHKPKKDDSGEEENKAEKKDDKKDDKKEEPSGGVASIVGKSLKLNGASGMLLIDKGEGKALKIVTLKLSGEVISNPSRKCEISIVGDGPIPAANEGTPDGLPRFAANVPACPLSFDVVTSGVIVPPQTQACVFQAADCQASPSGVWGPDAASLSGDTRKLAADRSKAEASIAESLKTLAKRSKGEEAELEREQGDFNALRDETCHDYEGESAHGFCDARMTQARAALLHKQVSKVPRKEKEKEKEKDKEQ